MRTALTCGAALVLAVACTTNSSVLSHGPTTSEAIPQGPGIHRDVDFEGARIAVSESLGVPADGLRVVQAFRLDNVVAVAFEGDGSDVRGFGYGELHDGSLVALKDWVTDFWATPPLPGSRQVPVASLAVNDRVLIGGFIDPRFTTVEAVTPEGVSDFEGPVLDGSVLGVAGVGDQLRVLDGEELVAASYVLSKTVPPSNRTHELPSEHLEAATRFLSAVQSAQWDDASQQLSSTVDPGMFLPQLGVMARDWILGEAAGSPFGAVVDVTTLSGPGVLTLFYIRESGGWKVWNYSFAISG